LFDNICLWILIDFIYQRFEAYYNDSPIPGFFFSTFAIFFARFSSVPGIWQLHGHSMQSKWLPLLHSCENSCLFKGYLFLQNLNLGFSLDLGIWIYHFEEIYYIDAVIETKLVEVLQILM
jgi:hypothetical protein